MFAFSTCFGGTAPGLPAIPPPAPLPSLPTALSRRAAIFGVVATTGVLVGSAARALGSSADTVADRRLATIVAEMTAAADAGDAVYAADPHRATESGAYSVACDRFYRAMRSLCATPAAGFGGVAIKARALSGPWVADCAETAAEIAASLAADVLRLEGGAS